MSESKMESAMLVSEGPGFSFCVPGFGHCMLTFHPHPHRLIPPFRLACSGFERNGHLGQLSGRQEGSNALSPQLESGLGSCSWCQNPRGSRSKGRQKEIQFRSRLSSDFPTVQYSYSFVIFAESQEILLKKSNSKHEFLSLRV